MARLRALTLPSFAKINLDLRLLGVRPDGYHDLRTVFQSLAVHDLLTFNPRPGPFALTCSAPELPVDERNLVWQAAVTLWRAAGHGRAKPRDVAVHLVKRIPHQAGLGGGSANAAIALLGLAHVWGLEVDLPTLSRLGASLGADVPFFLVGGTALGLGRGDDIYPLVDLPPTDVVIVRPSFGVSTANAYGWYDTDPKRKMREVPAANQPPDWPAWARTLRNDLEGPVTRRHPTIARIKQSLLAAGAVTAAMSGSGSAVFGLFDRPEAAKRTAADLARPGWHVVATRTLARRQYARRLRSAVAGARKGRIH